MKTQTKPYKPNPNGDPIPNPFPNPNYTCNYITSSANVLLQH